MSSKSSLTTRGSVLFVLEPMPIFRFLPQGSSKSTKVLLEISPGHPSPPDGARKVPKVLFEISPKHPTTHSNMNFKIDKFYIKIWKNTEILRKYCKKIEIKTSKKVKRKLKFIVKFSEIFQKITTILQNIDEISQNFDNFTKNWRFFNKILAIHHKKCSKSTKKYFSKFSIYTHQPIWYF